MSARLEVMRAILATKGISAERYAEIDIGVGARVTREEARLLCDLIEEFVLLARPELFVVTPDKKEDS